MQFQTMLKHKYFLGDLNSKNKIFFNGIKRLVFLTTQVYRYYSMKLQLLLHLRVAPILLYCKLYRSAQDYEQMYCETDCEKICPFQTIFFWRRILSRLLESKIAHVYWMWCKQDLYNKECQLHI